MSALRNLIPGNALLSYWLAGFIVAGFAYAIYSGYFKARKIQPKGFNWKTFRNEFFFAIITIVISAAVLQWIGKTLTANGIIAYNHEPAAWWVIALEYAAYFVLFDTWFYWLHRLMHINPIYTYVHKLHHYSTSPNLLTTLSVNPLESLVNGGFVPLFTAVFTVHDATMAMIIPTNIIMGLYVHSGYELLPRWWNKTWATKWFITATFHDQHHKYFNFNYGGYTTLWDRICGTQRKKYEEDFVMIKDRASKTLTPVVATQSSPQT
jgi:sterol desaturase/sphingolipid hydroxylase (fatty acid hydroxylase superfamily)